MTMTEPLIETKYGTAAFSRKVNDGDYGHTEASLYVPFVYDAADDAGNQERIANAFLEAKCHVYNELHIPFSQSPEGLVQEIQGAFPGATVAKATPAPQAAPQLTPQGREYFPDDEYVAPPQPQPQSQGGGGGIKIFKRLKTAEFPDGVPNPDWLQRQIDFANKQNEANETEFWDNRADLPKFGGNRSAKSPWFKGKNNKDVAVWPPKGHPDSGS